MSPEPIPLSRRRTLDAIRSDVNRARQGAVAIEHALRQLLGVMAYYVNAGRARVMDALDSRPVPTPHPVRKPPRGGRWSEYLAGRSSAGTDLGDLMSARADAPASWPRRPQTLRGNQEAAEERGDRSS